MILLQSTIKFNIMKKLITLFIFISFIINGFAQVLFCDDFDSYQNGDPIAATSSDWETWGSITSPTPPYVDDADVTNILSNSGDFSLYFEYGARGAEFWCPWRKFAKLGTLVTKIWSGLRGGCRAAATDLRGI